MTLSKAELSPRGGGYSHIFMDTYAPCQWMGFESKMYTHGWVIFQKCTHMVGPYSRKSENFGTWMDFEGFSPRIFGTRMGLTMKIE